MTTMIPCKRPEFSQGLDRTRPSVLVTPLSETKVSGQLEYRYTDTDEITLVPNAWYNQTVEMRIGYYNFMAEVSAEHKRKLETNPPIAWTEAQVSRAIEEAETRRQDMLLIARTMAESGVVTA